MNLSIILYVLKKLIPIFNYIFCKQIEKIVIDGSCQEVDSRARLTQNDIAATMWFITMYRHNRVIA